MRRAREWTRALSDWWALAAGHGRVHGRLPRAPRGDHAARRLVAGCARTRRAARVSDSSRRGIPPRASRATARESSSGCRATSPAPRRRIGRRARSAGSRSRASPSCDSRRDAPTPPSRRSGARRRPRRIPSSARRLLPAFVEITLAAGDVDAARRACAELEEISSGYESAMLGAIVAHARGAVHLADAEPREALVSLRKAVETWHALDAPYEIARTRALVGDACRLLGDEEAAVLEHEAATSIFERLGATPDLARFEAPSKRHGLSPRRARGAPARRRRQDEPARSPRRWSSASTRSRGTSRTSSRSSASPPAPPRRRSRSSTTSSDAYGHVVGNDHVRAIARLVDPCDVQAIAARPTVEETTRRRRWQPNRSTP